MQICFPSIFQKKLQLISETRSLSADCLPSLLGASACGVSASQLFGRSVANFFNPIRITRKNMKDKLILNMLRDKTNLPLKKLQLISEIRSLSADCRQASSAQAPAGSRLASYSAGVSQISSIQ
ncbi:hypothetical protein ACJEBK_23900 [Peribacillus frigoritolerans]|uniref:hypothetical protein n=1 Tax=Peribacillus TaxID=2675229 RepID=UPI0038711960